MANNVRDYWHAQRSERVLKCISSLTFMLPILIFGLIVAVSALPSTRASGRCELLALNSFHLGRVDASASKPCLEVPLASDLPSLILGLIAAGIVILRLALNKFLNGCPVLFAELGIDITDRLELDEKKVPVRYIKNPLRLAGAGCVGLVLSVFSYLDTYLWQQNYFRIIAHAPSTRNSCTPMKMCVPTATYAGRWWANWHEHWYFAISWIAVGTIGVVLAIDNFATSTSLVGRVKTQLLEHGPSKFVPNYPGVESAWRTLNDVKVQLFAGVVQALLLLAFITLLVADTRSQVATVILVAVAASGATFLMARYTTFGRLLVEARSKAAAQEINKLDRSLCRAEQTQDAKLAAHLLLRKELVLKYLDPGRPRLLSRLTQIGTALVALLAFATAVETLLAGSK